jgi:hypothetical protein
LDSPFYATDLQRTYDFETSIDNYEPFGEHANGMKVLTTILIGFLTAGSAAAQEVNAQASKDAPAQTTVEAGKDAAKKLEEKKRADAQLLKNPITYSGFATDVVKAKDKTKLLNLRQPNDPKNDLKYVFYEPRGRAPKGFVLFSVDF